MPTVQKIEVSHDPSNLYDDETADYYIADELPYMVNLYYVDEGDDEASWYVRARFVDKDHALTFAQKLQQQNPNCELINNV